MIGQIAAYIDDYFTHPDYPSMSIAIVFLRMIKLWRPAKIYYLIPFFMSLIFLSQVVYVLISDQPLRYFLNIFQTGFFHLGLAKVAFYFYNHQKWLNIIYWLSDLERTQLQDPHLKPIVLRYIRYGRILNAVIYPFCFIVFALNYGENYLMVAIQMESKGEIDPTYITFFWLWPTEPLKGKLIVYPYVTLQWFYAFGGVSYLMAFDGICVSVMMGLAGQIQVLHEMFRRALDTDVEEQQKRNLTNCYKRYIELVEKHETCNAIMSPVLFMYLLVASINMGMILYSLPSLEKSSMYTSMVLVSSLIVEAFYFFWHGHEVKYQSEIVSAAVYDCDWVEKSPEIRHLVYKMSATTNSVLIFRAGPFNEVTVITFIAIVKVTYSFYKLMTTTVTHS
ncbi:uncharacterized protein LOC119691498 [Plutella xylostella]|uniref:uncharacterized protein LOC119691498 n=1 Tax=Plutella xylostella TaxID=51655 RepID=UPI00203297F6|nr:uncharacterized protein LOC119691498 [Plutella xylostella]